MTKNTEQWSKILAKRLASRAGSGVPVYRYFADVFSGLIGDGLIRPGTRLPVDREFAELVGISHITLARGLNELRKKGLIERSRAHGTFIARTMPGGRSEMPLVAVLFDDITPEVICSTIFPALYNELAAQGCRMLFYSAAGDSATQSRQLIEIFQNTGCIGALVWSVMDRTDLAAAMSCKPANWPLIFLNVNWDDFLEADSICYNCGEAIFELARRFLASGGEKIKLCVTGDYLNNTPWQKIKAACDSQFGQGTVSFERAEFLARQWNDKTLVVTNFREGDTPERRNCVGIAAQNGRKGITRPTVYFHLPLQAKKAVELLQRRISSPQSAYRHLQMPYSLLNMKTLNLTCGGKK